MNAFNGLKMLWERQDRRASFLLCLVLFTAFAVLTLKPVWIAHGWPKNHEGIAFALRTRVYADHFRQHDFFPVWSSTDNHGFGSPMPALYHRLYYYFSAPVFLATKNIKLALALPIVVFQVAGAFGMVALLRFLGAGRATCIAGGICLIAAKYTVTNWLIRGAVAEFSAAMLIPWALYYFLRSLRENRVSPGLAVTLGLIFLGHSVICYYLVLIFGAVFLGALVLGKIRLNRPMLGSAAGASALFGGIVAPSLLVMSTVQPHYDMERILTQPYQPFFQFRPLIRYFWDEEFVFGHTWDGFTVQLDLPPLVLALAGVASLLLGRRFQRGDASAESCWKNAAPLAPLAVIGLIAFFLQTPWSAFLYRHVPGALYLQFSWRLLGILTPVIIAIGLYFAEKEARRWNQTGAVTLCTAAMVLLCGSFAPHLYGNLPKGCDLKNELQGVSFSSEFHEYKPKAVPLPAPTRGEVLQEARDLGAEVTFKPSKKEVRRMKFTVESANAATIPLPLFVTPLHEIKIYGPDGALLQRAAPEAGLCRVAVPEGKCKVLVEMPDIKKCLRWRWKRLLGEPARVGLAPGGEVGQSGHLL